MNSPSRLPIVSTRETIVDSLETQLKAVTAERDMYQGKIKQLERQIAESGNVSGFRDSFITGVLETFAYFLRYSPQISPFFSTHDEQMAVAFNELLHNGGTPPGGGLLVRTSS